MTDGDSSKKMDDVNFIQRPCSADDSFELIDYADNQQSDQSTSSVTMVTENSSDHKCSCPETTTSKDFQCPTDINTTKCVCHCDSNHGYCTKTNSDDNNSMCSPHQNIDLQCKQLCSQSNSHSHTSENFIQSECQSSQMQTNSSQSDAISNAIQSDSISNDEHSCHGQSVFLSKKPEDLSLKIKPLAVSKENIPTPVKRRGKPVTKADFEQVLDKDGRLVDEHAFRKAIFMGGVDPEIRREVWQFLFGLYPCTSTYREREELLLDYIMKYHELKARWKTMLVLNAKPGATLLQQGLVARYQVEDHNNTIRSPDLSPGDYISEYEMMEKMLMDGKMKADKPDFNVLSKNFTTIDVQSPEMQQKIDFMKIQAQVFVNRQKVDVKSLWNHLRVIDKDVPRTDRDLEYFKGTMNPNLTVLRNILLTFVSFHPHIGYAQGMNDILAQFLVVFDSEVEAYWCFRNYLEKIQHEFTEEGMVSKIALVVLLLQEMDPALLEHLKANDLGDLLFCHRWLLLGFKREFSFMESLRCFEILSSHHLELTSMEAEKTRRNELKKEFENQGGVSRTSAPSDVESHYTFELFMCVALLHECRPELMACTDTASVYQTINGLQIKLDEILLKSADLFYSYCKKSVEESFLMVDTPAKGKSGGRS